MLTGGLTVYAYIVYGMMNKLWNSIDVFYMKKIARPDIYLIYIYLAPLCTH